MELLFTNFVLLLLVVWLLFRFLKSSTWYRRLTQRLPPGPYPLPIIGNMHQFGKTPHYSLAKLSKTYGPLMHLKLASVDTIVVSSFEIAKEILQKHDYAFPRRMPIDAVRAHGHHEKSVAWLPVGAKWHALRRIMKENMFSTQRMEASQELRQEMVTKLLDYVHECCVDGREVNIGEAAFVTSLNLISNTLFTIDVGDYRDRSCHEIMEVVRGTMRSLSIGNISDLMPVLRWLDLQGFRRDADLYVGKLLSIFEGIINQRLEQSPDSPKKSDLLEALLQISRSNTVELSCRDISHLLLDLFVGGTDTTSKTVEWIMTELLRNPHVMAKVKTELREVLGKNKQVKESNIPCLPYLQAVVKENFRFRPTGPFLARYNDVGAIEISPFVIPKNAMILINIWAISRDPTIWSNPEQFIPERFLNAEGEIDMEGPNSLLIPFGVGRRICPGMPLASRMLHIIVGSLVNNFDWELKLGMQQEQVDLSEEFGIALQKSVPLMALPVKS